MQRLTNRSSEGVAYLYNGIGGVNDAIDRLYAYEETGLTPEEIKEMMTDWIVWKEAEAGGRLMVLPIKFYQPFYQVVVTDRRHTSRPSSKPIISVKYSELTWNNLYHVIHDFGKTVFSTREEAVEVMDKMRKEA